MSTGFTAMQRVIDASLLQIYLTSECKSIDFPSYLSLSLFLANIKKISILFNLHITFCTLYRSERLDREYCVCRGTRNAIEWKREKKIFCCSCGTCSELLTLCCLQVEEMRHKIPSTYARKLNCSKKSERMKQGKNF